MDPQQASERIRRFCAANGGSVLFDPASATVLDAFSGKALVLDLGALASLDERENREVPGRYLVLTWEDGRALVLAPPGLAFAPDIANTGPLASLPQAVAFRDFAAVTGKLRHILEDHPDEPPTREEVDMAMFAIALLDGARRVGFEVDREERELEALLALLERRGAPVP
ncbi:MAG: hypothetical protein ACYDCL_04775 [Myxococcales bacterium]